MLADELNKVILFKIKTINWEKLEKQLSEDDLEGILNILINKNKSQSREEAILILGRLSALDKEKRLGIIDDKDATIERNKIRISILNFMKFLKAKEN